MFPHRRLHRAPMFYVLLALVVASKAVSLLAMVAVASYLLGGLFGFEATLRDAVLALFWLSLCGGSSSPGE